MFYASDFSYTERAIIEVWVWLWFIQRVWSTDKFASLRWSKIRNFDLKSIITLLILLMLPAQATFDVIWSYLKYSEGMMRDPATNNVVEKPPYMIDGNTNVRLWSEEDVLLKNVTEYVLACGFAFQIGTLALMQAFWSHLSSQMGGKPFMRSWKFRFYFGWVFASIIIFPMARFFSSHDIILCENVPQFIFSIQLLFISLLGIKNGRRLNDLLMSIQQQSSPRGQETIVRIHYFIEMNKLLSIGALLISVGLSSITFDAIFRFDRINQSKFLMDLLMIHTNFGSIILWGTMILIIYPRYYLIGLSDIPNDHLSSEFEQNKTSKHPAPSYMVDLNMVPNMKSKTPITPIATTSTTITMSTSTSQPMSGKDSSLNYKVGQTVSNILEHQAKQIESYRHKTSMSISSIATSTSNNIPSTPLTPSSPLTPTSPVTPSSTYGLNG